jgi:hypothetical protein
VKNSRLHPCKQRWFSAAERGTIFRDREDVRPEGLRATGFFQRETSLEMKQRFIVGPDDE